MNTKFVFIVSSFCAVYLIGSGAYYLFFGEAVPADGSFRDLKPIYDLIPSPLQGIVDLLLGGVCLTISFGAGVGVKSATKANNKD